jgi:hypothetical protein
VRSSATITFNTYNEYVGEIRQRKNISNTLGDALKCDGMNIMFVIGVMNEQARVKHQLSVEFNNRTCIKLPVVCVLYKECAFSPYVTRQFFPPASFVSVTTAQISKEFGCGRFGVNVMFPLICVKFISNSPFPLFFQDRCK